MDYRYIWLSYHGCPPPAPALRRRYSSVALPHLGRSCSCPSVVDHPCAAVDQSVAVDPFAAAVRCMRRHFVRKAAVVGTVHSDSLADILAAFGLGRLVSEIEDSCCGGRFRRRIVPLP